MMNLCKGSLGIRGHSVLCVLISLLVSAASSPVVDNPEADVSSLQLKLNLMKSRYRLLCNQYNKLANNCASPVIRCSQCPDGWIIVGDQCFFLSNDMDDYFNSTRKCEEVGAHLAILTTKEQHEAVEKNGKRIGGYNSYFWIGLTDIENEGKWKWTDNSTLTTPFWKEQEPERDLASGPEGRDCVVVYSYTQKWSDVPCNFVYPRICQMAAIPPQ